MSNNKLVLSEKSAWNKFIESFP